MGGIAAIAKQLGHQVTGSDLNVYPPMSTQLESLGISLTTGWDPQQLNPEPDLVIIGNALSRGNPAVEYVLERNIPYTSGPEWLKKEVLQNRWVIAVSGTHGKTSTASMVAWLLESCGMNPGFLIGGVPGNFEVSARLGDAPFFVIEADEYDTAFFDKRSKFVHYLPKTLIINNLEFDHADIFKDLGAIQTQFHHLIRILPKNGLLIQNPEHQAVQETIAMGCWSQTENVGQHDNSASPDDGIGWQYKPIKNRHGHEDGTHFEVLLNSEKLGEVIWSLTGEHNMQNAIAALAATRHCGMSVSHCIEALGSFKNAKRRMELIFDHANIKVYDDFAHHPTAIQTTLEGLRAQVGNKRIFAILEPRSNTMKMGVHKDTLANSWQAADSVYVYQADQDWQISPSKDHTELTVSNDLEQIVQDTIEKATPYDHIVIMSNGGFGGIHKKITTALNQKFPRSS